MLIIVGREHGGLYEGLKSRQEANGKDRVILERRSAERRHAGGLRPKTERRTGDRRLPLSAAECALMNVLGFAVVHRELSVLPTVRIPQKPPARRAAGRPSTRIPKLPRKRAAS